jgi:hypothetical protein
VQIVRADLNGQGLNGQGLDRQIPAPGTMVVRSLPEVEALFGE